MHYQAILLSLLFWISFSTWVGKLKFRNDGTFKILQLTDLHFGGNDSQDIRNYGLMFKLIQTVSPDLVVLTGDMFSGNSKSCHGINPEPYCYERGWKTYTLPLRSLKQKYAIVLGNHDIEANLNAKEIIDLDMTSEFSLTQQSPVGVSDGSNYYLPIYDEQEMNIDSLLWMFDSHKNGCLGQHSLWGCVEKDQIQWFNKQYKQLLQEARKEIIQSLSFVHIPPPEYVTMYNENYVQGNKRERICCPCYNSGFVDSLLQNDVQANFVGHDHDNDFSGFFGNEEKKIELHYGRKSGYGSYGPPPDMMRGGTVITIKSQKNGYIGVESQIMDEMGNLIPKTDYIKRNDKVDDCECRN